MKTPTYQEYLADPSIHEQLEREARRARSQAFDQFIVTPVLNLFRRPCHPTPIAPTQLRTA